MAQDTRDPVPYDNFNCARSLHPTDTTMDRRRFGQLLAGVGGGAILDSPSMFDHALGIYGVGCVSSGGALTLSSRESRFTVDAAGLLSAITKDGHNLVADEQPSRLLSLRIAGKLYAPNRASWNDPATRIQPNYDAVGATAGVAAEAKPTHVTFEVVELQSVQPVELVLWGPYATSINDLVGEIVGVDFATLSWPLSRT